MFVFRKMWHALFSWNTRFEICPFAILPMLCHQCSNDVRLGNYNLQALLISTFVRCCFWLRMAANASMNLRNTSKRQIFMYRNYRLFDMAYVSLTSFFFEVRHVIFWGRSLKVLKAALRKSNSVEICEQVVLLTRSCQYSLYPS